MRAAADGQGTIARVIRAFRGDTPARERLPGGGTVHIDRTLPYVFVYRQPRSRSDAGTRRLVLGEASWIEARDGDDDCVRELLRELATVATSELGSFLILEIWSGAPGSDSFAVHAPGGPAAAAVDVLARGLEAIDVSVITAPPRVHVTEERHPPDLPPLLTAHDCWRIGCLSIGVEVPPVYRDDEGDVVYPVFLRRMRSLLSPVLRQTAFEFARVQTKSPPQTYRAFGPRHFDRSLADADAELAAIEAEYSLLLLVSPINTHEAWTKFRDGGFDTAPSFRYRLLPVDPDVLRRRLWSIDLEDIADPAMAFLLHDKRTELDRQITMLSERNTPQFRLTSMKLYGPVDDLVLNVARDILDAVPPAHASASVAGMDGDAGLIDALGFAERAREELDFFRTVAPSLAAEVQLRPDVTGLMVSRGNLLIGENLGIRPARLDALIQHEVGTHMLTWYNGTTQPLRQMYTGLADYDELQEGLAVFAEYMVGALDAARMRILAARVVAAHSAEHEATFIDTFRLLANDHGFRPGTAFDVAERVHQSGGFTRDMIYLRGLLQLVEHVRAGGALEPLYAGKIAARHIEVVEELQARGYLRPPALLPRFIARPTSAARLRAVRDGLPLTRMID